MIVIRDLKVRLGNFELNIPKLEIRNGEYFVVMGPSGAGKTTLLYTLLGVYRPESGRIMINGVDVTYMPIEKRGMAIIPQNYALFPNMNVYENIAFGLKVRGYRGKHVYKRVMWVAEILGIKHLLNRVPTGLSGGEQQRVALARALAINPKIILLDEPLSNLDPELRVRARQLLKEVRLGIGLTAIHATHNIVDAVVLADRIAYLKDGALMTVMDVKEFLKTDFAQPYIEDVDIGLALRSKDKTKTFIQRKPD